MSVGKDLQETKQTAAELVYKKVDGVRAPAEMKKDIKKLAHIIVVVMMDHQV